MEEGIVTALTERRGDRDLEEERRLCYVGSPGQRKSSSRNGRNDGPRLGGQSQPAVPLSRRIPTELMQIEETKRRERESFFSEDPFFFP